MGLTLLLLILGGLLFVAVGIAAAIAREQRQTRRRQDLAVPVALAESNDAVIVAEGRGHIVFINLQARKWLGLDEQTFSLEAIAKAVQPPDRLLELFSKPGRASFRIGERYVEASGYMIDHQPLSQWVVVMHELTDQASSTRMETTSRAMQAVIEITETLNTQQPLEDTFADILKAVNRIINSDLGEIALWESAPQVLRPAIITGSGAADYKQMVAATDGLYHLDDSLSGWVARYRQPLLIADVQTRADLSPRLRSPQVTSYVGVPLIASDQLIGTLELASGKPSAFSYEDMTLLQTIAAPLAIAIESHHLNALQSERAIEVSGLQNISQMPGSMAEPREVYEQISTQVAQMINAEMCGIMLYDTEQKVLIAQIPFYNVSDVVTSVFRIPVDETSPVYPLWENQNWWVTNDVIHDELVRALGLINLAEMLSVRNAALFPLTIGNQRVGALMVMNRSSKFGFSEEDLRLLSAFATQAAVVVENARLNVEQRQTTASAESLNQLRHLLASTTDQVAANREVTRQVAKLINTAICGILRYEETQSRFVAQSPFMGVPDNMLRFCELTSPAGSVLDQLYRDGEAWYINDFADDPLTRTTDIGRLGPVLSLHQILFVPLIAGTRHYGMLLIANKQDDLPFTAGDARHAAALGAQIAILMDNLELAGQVRSRAYETKKLSQLAEVLSSALSLDEMLSQACRVIAELFDSQMSSVALIDEKSGTMNIQPTRAYGVPNLTEPFVIDVYAQGMEYCVAISKRNFLSNDVPANPRTLPIYRVFAQRYNLQQAIQVPLLIQNRSLGELSVGNSHKGYFIDDDVRLLQAVSAQVAIAIEHIQDYREGDARLSTRLEELDSLSRVAQELNVTVELDRLLEVIGQEAQRTTNAQTVTIALLADFDRWPNPMSPVFNRRIGGSAPKDNADSLWSIERQSILDNHHVVVADYQSSPLELVPQDARSALALPIEYNGQIAGVLHLYSSLSNAFPPRSVDFSRALSSQIAVALGNASRYQQQFERNRALTQRAEQMSQIFQIGRLLNSNASIETILDAVANGITEALGFNIVLISIADTRFNVMRRIAQAGIPLAIFQEIQQKTPPVADAERLFTPQYRVSSSYFFPEEQRGDWGQIVAPYEETSNLEVTTDPNAWHQRDMLVVPLRGSSGRLIGMISADDPRDHKRPTALTIEAIEVFANHATFAIENYLLLQDLLQEASLARLERDRMSQLYRAASDVQRAPDAHSRLQIVADGIRSAGWEKVSITLRDAALDSYDLITAGYNPDEYARLEKVILPGMVWQGRLADPEFRKYRIGEAYYLRATDQWVTEPKIIAGLTTPTNLTPVPGQPINDRWDSLDILYLPLYGLNRSRPIGIVAMSDPQDGKSPTEATLRPIELFVGQAASLIENVQLYQETIRAADQEQRLNTLMEAIASSLSLNEIVAAMANGLRQLLPYTQMSLGLVRGSEQMFRMLAVRLDIRGEVVAITDDVPLTIDGSVMGRIYEALSGRVFYAQKPGDDTATHYPDLMGWQANGEQTSLVVPMIAGGRAAGVLHVGSSLIEAYGFKDQLPYVQRVANLTAVALENARLFEDTIERERFNAALGQINRSLIGLTSADDFLNALCDNLTEFFNVAGAAVWLPVESADASAKTLRVAAASVTVAALRGQTLSLQRSTGPRHPAAVAYQDGHALLYDRTDTTYAPVLPIWTSIIAFPINRGVTVGALVIGSNSLQHPLTSSDLERVATFAAQAALGLETASLYQQREQSVQENVRLYGEARQQAERLGLLNHVSDELSQSLDIENILEVAMRYMVQILGMDHAAAILIEGDRGRLVIEYPRNLEPPQEIFFTLNDNPLVDQIRQTLEPLQINDLSSDLLTNGLRDLLTQYKAQSALYIPLLVGGQLLGILQVDDKVVRTELLPTDQLDMVKTVVSQTAIAVQNANLFEQSVRRTRELETLFESLRVTSSTLELDAVLNNAATQMIVALGASRCEIALLSPQLDQLDFQVEALQSEADMSIAVKKLTGQQPLSDYPMRRDVMTNLDLGLAYVTTPNLDAQEKSLLESRGAFGRMLIPMIVREQAIGLVTVENSEAGRVFDFSQRRLARALVAQFGIAVDNARLQTTTNEKLNELFTINDLAIALASTIEMEALYRVIQVQVPRLIKSDVVVLALYDPEKKEVSYPVAQRNGQPLAIPARPLGTDEVGYVIRQRSPLLLAGDSVQEVRQAFGITDSLTPNGAYLAIPLQGAGVDELLGVLAVGQDGIYGLGLDQQRVLTTIGSQLSVSIQNAQSFARSRMFTAELEQRVRERTEELQRERDQLNFLLRVTSSLAGTLDITQVLDRALEMIVLAVDAEIGLVLGVDSASSNLVYRATYGLKSLYSPDEMSGFTQDEGLAGWIVQTQRSVMIENVQEDARWINRARGDEELKSALAVLLTANNDVMGVLMLYHRQANKFTEEHLRLINAAANQIATAMNNSELYGLVREQAERLGMMVRREQVESTKTGAIVESLGEGIMVTNEEGEVIQFNATAERVLGLSRRSMLNRSINDLSGLYMASGGEQWLETLQSWIDDPKGFKLDSVYQTQLTLENKQIVNVVLSPVSMGDQFLGTVSIFRDVTREVEVDRMKSEFISTVSHELRTPLTAIKGYIDLMLMTESAQMDGNQQGMLNTIKSNADRLSTLVSGLLDISRIEQGSVKLTMRPVDLSDIIASSATHLGGRILGDEKPMHVVTNVEPNLPLINGDRDKLTQVLNNLADNAFNYTPVNGTITIGARSEPGSVVVTVKDDGIGIAPENHARIFERFFRDESNTLVIEAPGTGLGLAIVKDYVEMHDGDIWLDSEPGKGTTFYLRFPAFSALESEHLRSSGDAAPVASESSAND